MAQPAEDISMSEFLSDERNFYTPYRCILFMTVRLIKEKDEHETSTL